MGGFFSFVWNQWTFKPKPLPENRSFRGTTLLITGGNIGLGYEAARELVAHGPATLILAVRDTSKGEAAKQAILKEKKGHQHRDLGTGL